MAKEQFIHQVATALVAIVHRTVVLQFGVPQQREEVARSEAAFLRQEGVVRLS